MKVIIKRGEKYPSDKAAASEIIKAVTYGQTKFQIYVYEISKEEVEPGSEFVDLSHTLNEDNPNPALCVLEQKQPSLPAKQEADHERSRCNAN